MVSLNFLFLCNFSEHAANFSYNSWVYSLNYGFFLHASSFSVVEGKKILSIIGFESCKPDFLFIGKFSFYAIDLS